MGKQRRQRQKLHIASKNSKNEPENTSMEIGVPMRITLTSANPFENLTIDYGSLNTSIEDDVVTVKSFKSIKSEKSSEKALKKREKLKLRRQYLLKKIDSVNQLKKEAKLRNKRKSTAIMGDTNPLHDALPSLQSLLKSSSCSIAKEVKKAKPRAVQKSAKRKRNLIQGVQIYKHILGDKKFRENPVKLLSEHIKSVVDQEKSKLKKQ